MYDISLLFYKYFLCLIINFSYNYNITILSISYAVLHSFGLATPLLNLIDELIVLTNVI